MGWAVAKGSGGSNHSKQLTGAFVMSCCRLGWNQTLPLHFQWANTEKKLKSRENWPLAGWGAVGESLSQVWDASSAVISRILTVEMTLNLLKQGHSTSMLQTAHWAVKLWSMCRTHLDFVGNMKKQAAQDVYRVKKRRRIFSSEESDSAPPAFWPLEVKTVLCGPTQNLEEVGASDSGCVSGVFTNLNHGGVCRQISTRLSTLGITGWSWACFLQQKGAEH